MNQGQRLLEIHDTVKDNQNKLKNIEREIFGSHSRPGLIKEVGYNSDYRKKSENRDKIIMGMFGSGWLIAFIVVILQVANVI